MKLLIIFISLSVFNVILQTVKSIMTVKCGKTLASLANAVAYGLYTVVLVYMNCDLALWSKIIVTAITNFIGVYIVKTIEDKMRKDKLWKVEATVKLCNTRIVEDWLSGYNVSYVILNTEDEDYSLFEIFCPTQKESAAVKEVLQRFHAKYFVSESKTL